MRLKSLDVKGFKSFANPIQVKFDEGVTGIVGPNGSGKSNIVDSIRWVLGEQKSRELRLESMGDVIFNGTKTKKKGGAASVTLTFENTKNILPTEFKDVAISRTLYRSGESEFKLNGVKCRLKDIKDLFLDSGIGSNTYAIIELGMVDSILSDKENARRKMFEQAAGISKYKIRKREALSKLALTKSDLDRVEDLLFELENSMKSLEKQAKRTERFYKIKEQYKELKVLVTKSQIIEYDRELHSMKAKRDQRLAHLTQVKASIAKAEVALEELKTKNLNDEKALGESQKALNELVSQIQAVEGTESLRKQELSFLRNSETELHKRIHENKSLQLDLNGKIEQQAETVDKERALFTTVSEELAKLQSAFELFRTDVNSKAELSNVQQQQSLEFQNQIFEKEKSLVKAEGDLNRAAERLADIKNTEDADTQKLSDLQANLVETAKLLKKLEEDFTKAEESYKTAIENEDKLKLDRREVSDEKIALQRELDRTVNESNMLKNMVDSLEGFPESVKFVHDVTGGKIPLLSDLFFCPKEYRNAVESYLESYLNYFVAGDEKEALAAIEKLKQGQKGRASFFILNQLADVTISTDPESVVSKLEFDKKYEHLFHYLFGDIKMKPSGDVAGEYILDDSTVIRRKYVVSGGSVGLFAGKKVGRKKTYEESIKKIDKLRANLEKVTSKLELIDNSLKNINNEQLRTDKGQIDIAYKNQKYKHDQLQQSYDQLSGASAQSQTLKTQYQNTITETTEAINLLKAEIIEINTAKEGVDQELNQEKNQLSSLQQDLSEQSAIVNARNIEKIRKENLINSLEDNRKATAERIAEVTSNIEKDQASINDVKTKLQQLANTGTDTSVEIKEMYAAKDQMTKDVAAIEQLYFQEKSTIQDQEKVLRDLNTKHTDLQSKINQNKEREQTFLYERKGLIDRLKIEFNIDEADVLAENKIPFPEGQEEQAIESTEHVEGEKEVDKSETASEEEGSEELVTQESTEPSQEEKSNNKTFNLTETKLKLERIEKRIANYGDINPLAITAFNEIKERYDYVISQRDDILEATEDLNNTIKEIEIEANAKFKTAFDQIKVHFQEVFRTFFTEDDTCDLVLIDEDNPLDSAIEIIARPKGKRPKSLSQLSGGEKTLTATALLFALYLLKPAPFCIFDEVDAPLDDLNVQKFTKLISQFSKNSQFVIITHNKVTMAAVDMLYGVFMQEVGVSEISAVDFTDKAFDFNYQGIEN